MTSIDPWKGYTAAMINDHRKQKRETWHVHMRRPSNVHPGKWLRSDLCSPTKEGMDACIADFLERHPDGVVSSGPYAYENGVRREG